MSLVYFEEKLIPITEDRIITKVKHESENGMMHETKTIELSISSGTHSYEDGYLLHLLFDHSGAEELIQPTLSFPDGKIVKKLLTVTCNCKLKINRLDKTNFLIKAHERASDEGFCQFLEVDKSGKMREISVRYSELLQDYIIDNKYVLLNFYEKISSTEKFHTIALYDIQGRQIDLVLDEKIELSEFININLEKKGDDYVVEYYKSEAFKETRTKLGEHTLKF